jgi:WD40 repeat protein
MLWDLASNSSAGCVADAHKMAVRDVSWAPNNEHRFVTGGDDGKLRFWDTRCVWSWSGTAGPSTVANGAAASTARSCRTAEDSLSQYSVQAPLYLLGRLYRHPPA